MAMTTRYTLEIAARPEPKKATTSTPAAQREAERPPDYEPPKRGRVAVSDILGQSINNRAAHWMHRCLVRQNDSKMLFDDIVSRYEMSFAFEFAATLKRFDLMAILLKLYKGVTVEWKDGKEFVCHVAWSDLPCEEEVEQARNELDDFVFDADKLNSLRAPSAATVQDILREVSNEFFGAKHEAIEPMCDRSWKDEAYFERRNKWPLRVMRKDPHTQTFRRGYYDLEHGKEVKESEVKVNVQEMHYLPQMGFTTRQLLSFWAYCVFMPSSESKVKIPDIMSQLRDEFVDSDPCRSVASETVAVCIQGVFPASFPWDWKAGAQKAYGNDTMGNLRWRSVEDPIPNVYHGMVIMTAVGLVEERVRRKDDAIEALKKKNHRFTVLRMVSRRLCSKTRGEFRQDIELKNLKAAFKKAQSLEEASAIWAMLTFVGDPGWAVNMEDVREHFESEFHLANLNPKLLTYDQVLATVRCNFPLVSFSSKPATDPTAIGDGWSPFAAITGLRWREPGEVALWSPHVTQPQTGYDEDGSSHTSIGIWYEFAQLNNGRKLRFLPEPKRARWWLRMFFEAGVADKAEVTASSLWKFYLITFKPLEDEYPLLDEEELQRQISRVFLNACRKEIAPGKYIFFGIQPRQAPLAINNVIARIDESTSTVHYFRMQTMTQEAGKGWPSRGPQASKFHQKLLLNPLMPLGRDEVSPWLKRLRARAEGKPLGDYQVGFRNVSMKRVAREEREVAELEREVADLKEMEIFREKTEQIAEHTAKMGV